MSKNKIFSFGLLFIVIIIFSWVISLFVFGESIASIANNNFIPLKLVEGVNDASPSPTLPSPIDPYAPPPTYDPYAPPPTATPPPIFYQYTPLIFDNFNR